MSQQDDSGQHEGDEFERITPAQVTPGARNRAEPVAGRKSSVPAALVWMALGLLLILAAGVFLWLPKQANPPQIAEQPSPATAPQTDETEAAPATPDSPQDAEALLAQREQAQKLADELAEKRKRLDEKSVERWAGEAAAENSALAQRAQQEFEQRQFTAAIASFRQAIDQADKLLARADEVLADALARGAQAFDDRDSSAAVEAFELALAIDAGNAQAQKGLKRAKSLDAVLAKTRSAEVAEDNGELGEARQAYQEALALDDEFTPAREGLARVNSKLSARAYGEQMSRGLAALERGDFAAAKSAFSAARKHRPGDADAGAGLAQANAGLQQQAINRLRDRARENVREEDWKAALEAYQAALKIDSSLGYAQTGKARAAKRLALDEKLQFHLNNPGRLSDDAVRGDVASLLAHARAVTDSGARLDGQISRLDSLLSAMSQPVTVQLRSDNQTRVLVYHVGDLGRFESKRLQLTPGDYTVVGRCTGYRDIRRTITVKPEQSQVGPIVIECKEKI